MSERNRTGATALGLAIAFLAVFLVGLWAGISKEEPPSPGGGLVESAQREASNEEVRFWGEGPAQWIIAGTSLAALFVSAIAVLLVRNTLATNVEATNAATKSANTAEKAFSRLERPYLFLKVIERWQLNNAQGVQPSVVYTLTNYGKTPAILEVVFAELTPLSKLKVGADRVPVIAPDSDVDHVYEVIAPDASLNNFRTVPLAGSKGGDRWDYRSETLALHCHISYSDPSRMVRYSHHFVMLTYNNRPFRLDFSRHSTVESEEKLSSSVSA